jgi:endonuclease-3 related protein
LTQNTAWKNVKLALANLKSENLLSLARIATTPAEELAPLIRPSGYYNLKARRLKSVAEFFAPDGRERFDELSVWPIDQLREALLDVKGVGPETADSILLYALDRLSFVVDAYTMRMVGRHGLARDGADYHEVRDLFTRHTEPELQTFNEYHALIVWAGHHFCKPTPLCGQCPLAERRFFKSARSWQKIQKHLGP